MPSSEAVRLEKISYRLSALVLKARAEGIEALVSGHGLQGFIGRRRRGTRDRSQCVRTHARRKEVEGGEADEQQDRDRRDNFQEIVIVQVPVS